MFWRRLIAAGILPSGTSIGSADDALVAAGHGITDLIKRPSPRDNASDSELRAGVGPLWQKVALWRPAAVVFVYKRAAESAAGRRLSARWGQLQGVALGGRPCFLMPGPYASAEDVAAQMNRTPGAVRMLLARARERLRDVLGSGSKYFSDVR